MKKKIDCNWHRYVDLGLPSGLLWATCNIGAKEPWESGLYFSWGNVDGHVKGSGFYLGHNTDISPYTSTPGASLTGNIPVNAEYDAARANIGGSWRMPTIAEFKELYGSCIRKWTTQNDVNGMLFISNINGNSVFFPAVGCYYGTVFYGDCTLGSYWSSSLRSQDSAYYLFFYSYDAYHLSNHQRLYCFPVRAVLDHPKDSLLIKTIKR